MAKKIKVEFPKKASECLKGNKIEHVLVEYHHEDGGDPHKKDDAFLVVQNKDLYNAKALILAGNISINKIKNVRHYENIALKHQHYQPTFDCTCRHCGKTFKSVVKEAVWCSNECKKAFRNAKKEAKIA